MRLPRRRRAGDGLEHLPPDREARIARLQPEDALSLCLGFQQPLPNLDDLAERDLVERMGQHGGCGHATPLVGVVGRWWRTMRKAPARLGLAGARSSRRDACAL